MSHYHKFESLEAARRFFERLGFEWKPFGVYDVLTPAPVPEDYPRVTGKDIPLSVGALLRDGGLDLCNMCEPGVAEYHKIIAKSLGKE